MGFFLLPAGIVVSSTPGKWHVPCCSFRVCVVLQHVKKSKNPLSRRVLGSPELVILVLVPESLQALVCGVSLFGKILLI